jgi:hypothetical protein
MLGLVAEKAGGSAVYDKHNTDDFFHILFVASDKNKRRGGLGKDLINRSMDLARTLGLKTCKAEATGMYDVSFFKSKHLRHNFVFHETNVVSPNVLKETQ